MRLCLWCDIAVKRHFKMVIIPTVASRHEVKCVKRDVNQIILKKTRVTSRYRPYMTWNVEQQYKVDIISSVCHSQRHEKCWNANKTVKADCFFHVRFVSLVSFRFCFCFCFVSISFRFISFHFISWILWTLSKHRGK